MAERDKAAVLALCNAVARAGITRQEAQEIYDSWAHSYDTDMEKLEGNWFLAAKELDSVLKDNKGAKVLDLGAGTGLVGVELQKFGFTNLDALDANRRMLEKAEEKGVYKNLICAELGPGRLDIPDDTYDALISLGMFMPGHLDHTCLEELIRITKIGGVIVLLELLAEGKRQWDPEFVDTLEPAIYRLQDQKLIQLISRNKINKLYEDEEGVAYVLQVTEN